MGAHRSGKYKQVNKKHNPGKHRTKREIRKLEKGKVKVVKNTSRLKKGDRASRKLQKKNLSELKKKRIEDITENKQTNNVSTVLTFVMLDDEISSSDILQSVHSCYKAVDYGKQVKDFIYNVLLPEEKRSFYFIILHYKSPILALETAFRISDVVIPSFKDITRLCNDPAVDGVIDLIRQLPDNKVLSFHFTDGSIPREYIEPFTVAFRARLQCSGVDTKSKFNELEIFSFMNEVIEYVTKGRHRKKLLMLQKNLKTPPIYTRPYMIIDTVTTCVSEQMPILNGASVAAQNFVDITFSGMLLGSKILQSNKHIYLSGFGMFPITLLQSEGVEHYIEHEVQDQHYSVQENDEDNFNIDEPSELSDNEVPSEEDDDEELNSSFEDIPDTETICSEVRGPSLQEELRGYRGMDNMKDTYWDPKVNTPAEYSQICKFPNFQSLQKHALKAEIIFDVGSYVSVCIRGVPLDVYAKFQSDQLATPCLFFLYPFEDKFTLNHYTVKLLSTYEQTLNDNDELLFSVDCALFKSSCLFSENKVVNKKAMQLKSVHGDEDYFRVSLYGPVIYLPAAVKIFKVNRESNELIMVAAGYATKPDPDLVILNRHTVEGSVYKVFKKYMIVKNMFTNKDDVLYFKPIQLKTKSGIKGHIIEPIGTHGSMKCKLSEVCRNQEKIMMHLYKRVFPTWDCTMNAVDEF